MRRQDPCFEKDVPAVGRFTLRMLDVPDDIPLVHRWVTHERAKYWGMQQQSVDDVESAYREILRQPGSSVFLGFHDDEPAFLVERYHPMEDVVGRYYDARPGDRGMHILVAPTDRPIAQFTWHVFTVVMDFLFSEDSVERIVVEPDVRNEKIHRLNRRAGFEYQDIIQLPKKTAYLAFCTRARYQTALKRNGGERGWAPMSGADTGVSHLTPGLWSTVNVLLVRKIIREFAHELLLEPRRTGSEGGWEHYVLGTDSPDIEYRFRAKVLHLEHWHIDAASIEKYARGKRARLDALSFILEIRRLIGIDPAMLPTYMEEITSTLYGGAYKHANQELGAVELAHAGFQDIERGMAEGHPVFVANNGRIGFDVRDYRTYAPEVGADVRLVWLAAHESRATFASASDLSYGDLMQKTLGAPTVQAFTETLRREGLNPDSYLFFPVHPWQWENKLACLFAPDLASRKLLYLGIGEEVYRAQQSIRTFFNFTRPEKHYIKTALSILNMGFMRGLSSSYMETTPAINEWIHALIEGDSYLRDSGFGILREVASVGYRHPHYEAAVTGDSPYKKMLAALWRESPVPRLAAGERLMTMAALLHRDRDGVALLPELIRASGVGAEQWVRRYLRCYLAPLLHCFYAHDLVFMPHGENIILVLRDHVPVRVVLKDIAEESAVLDARVLPEKVRRLSVSVPEEMKVLSLFIDVFDCFFRYLAELLWEERLCSETGFWRLVAECVLEYQWKHPELSEKFRRHDLFAAEFRRSCLNRLQIANNRQMIDLADPAKNLQFAGTLANPIASFRSTGREDGHIREFIDEPTSVV